MTLADAIAKELHQAIENHRDRLHRDVEAIIGHYVTTPNLARELADQLAVPAAPVPLPPAPDTAA